MSEKPCSLAVPMPPGINNQLQEATAAVSAMAGRELQAMGEQVAAQLGAHTRAAMADLHERWGFAPADIRGKR